MARGNGNGRTDDDDEVTEPDILVSIHDELFRQSEILNSFDARFHALEESISIVMNSYTGHNLRISQIEDTCESRGRIISKLLITPTPIPTAVATPIPRIAQKEDE